MSSKTTFAGDEQESGTSPSKQSFVKTLLKYLDDATVLKFAFYTLLFGVTVTLIMDYRELVIEDETSEQLLPVKDQPILPSFTPPTIERQSDGETPPERTRPPVTADPSELNKPMRIELAAGGVLRMTGSITPGIAQTFREKTKEISEYIKLIELNSPGGSVSDALEISTEIRENGWTTKVSTGSLCASSCPIVFAGGKKRIAEKDAAIGVHQVFAIGEDKRSNSEAISRTQQTTAKITRHLETMGVDPVLWIHALETPPQNLFYLNEAELEKFKLTTNKLH